MPISNRCISGLMSNLIKKSWTVSKGEDYTVIYQSFRYPDKYIFLRTIMYIQYVSSELGWGDCTLILEYL